VSTAPSVINNQGLQASAPGIILMRARIAEIHQHAVAHVLGHETVETGNCLRDALLVIGADHKSHVFGRSRLVESAVEPTRSVNITVTSPRPASSCQVDPTAPMGLQPLGRNTAGRGIRGCVVHKGPSGANIIAG
jgi:hypothetical protein